MSSQGAEGCFAYNGSFYGYVYSKRRGRTSYTWSKPKLKLNFKQAVRSSIAGRGAAPACNSTSEAFASSLCR